MHKQQELVCEHDREHIFCKSLQELKEYTTAQLQAWVTTYHPVFARAIQDAEDIAVKGTRDMRDYFQVRRPP